MPSLLNTKVTANYGRMVQQDTYATGAHFGNMGLRPVRLLKVTLSSVTNGDLTLQDGQTADASLTAAYGYDTTTTTGWRQPNSLFGRLVRTLQNFGEIYYVGEPSSTIFMALVAADTVNDADTTAGTQNTASTLYTQIEAEMAKTVAGTLKYDGTSGGSSATVTITATGTAANKNMFVGGALGTFA